MNISELITDAREVGTFLGDMNGGTILLDLADALEALDKKNRALEQTLAARIES